MELIKICVQITNMSYLFDIWCLISAHVLIKENNGLNIWMIQMTKC